MDSEDYSGVIVNCVNQQQCWVTNKSNYQSEPRLSHEYTWQYKCQIKLVSRMSLNVHKNSEHFHSRRPLSVSRNVSFAESILPELYSIANGEAKNALFSRCRLWISWNYCFSWCADAVFSLSACSSYINVSSTAERQLVSPPPTYFVRHA
jgi:hypothetical protein